MAHIWKIYLIGKDNHLRRFPSLVPVSQKTITAQQSDTDSVSAVPEGAHTAGRTTCTRKA